MKYLYTLLCSLVFLCGNSQTQKTISGDTLAADFEYLVKLLETSHPDPYSGFGGKVFFHKAAFDLKNQLLTSPHSLQKFHEQVSAFLSNLQDGHTGLYGINNETYFEQRILPIRLKVIPDGLIVTGLPEKDKVLLGSRITAINDCQIDSLLSLIANIKPCENIYDHYYQICIGISKEYFLRQLFPKLDDSISLTLLTPDNNTETIQLPLLEYKTATKKITAFVPTSNEIPTQQLSYKFLDKDKQVMIINIDQIMARDNFEYIYNNNWGGLMEQMAGYYRMTGKDMPADTLEAIKNIPSFSETFAEMLNVMKSHNSKTLIIDLRGNGGGWTPITLPTLYQLHGSRYVTTDMGTEFYQLISPLLLQKMNTDIGSFNHSRNSNWKIGDYTFSTVDTTNIPSVREQCDYFIKYCMSSVPDLLMEQKGKPIYTPQEIYVITDCYTFSAAFHYTFYLWKLGATVVGIPSRQAPNTFMEQTSFRLPHTGLQGSISNSQQIFLPAKDKRAKIFYPDLMPSYDDYKKYNFDNNTEILFLLDKLKYQSLK